MCPLQGDLLSVTFDPETAEIRLIIVTQHSSPRLPGYSPPIKIPGNATATYVGKPPAIGKPTRSTQPFFPSRSINE